MFQSMFPFLKMKQINLVRMRKLIFFSFRNNKCNFVAQFFNIPRLDKVGSYKFYDGTIFSGVLKEFGLNNFLIYELNYPQRM